MSDPVDSGGDRAALAMALVAIFGLSMKGVFAKFAYIAGASVLGLVLVRMIAALPLFWLASLAMKGRNPVPMARRDVGLALAFGLLFLLATLCDFAAIDRLGVGLSRIVLFTYPLIVVFVAAAMERRLPTRNQLAAFVIAYIGIIIVLRPDRLDLPDRFWSGVGLSLLCAFSIAIFYALTNPLIRRIGSGRFSTLTQLSALIGMSLISVVTFEADTLDFNREAYLWIALIVVVATVAPMLMQYEAMRRIGAARVSLIGLFGPIITVTVAWVVLEERLDAIQLGGFALVLVGIGILEWPQIRRKSGA
jgi:drug/metabolite transporter (DMT)-like permease